MIDFSDLDQLYGQSEGASSGAPLGGTADGMGTPYGSAQPEPLGDIATPAPDAISDGDPADADPRFGRYFPRPCNHCFPCNCDIH
jgi:hypothetical protein